MRKENIINILNKNKFFLNNNSKVFIKIENGRNIRITKFLYGARLAVHNGKYFIPMFVRNNMNGYLLSSFLFTRSILIKQSEGIFLSRKKKKKKKRWVT